MVASKFDQDGADALIAPRRNFAITKHDTNPLPEVTRCIYVGAAGDLKVRGVEDSADVTFKAVPVGTTIVGQFTHVRSTGTTAADLVGQA